MKITINLSTANSRGFDCINCQVVDVDDESQPDLIDLVTVEIQPDFVLHPGGVAEQTFEFYDFAQSSGR